MHTYLDHAASTPMKPQALEAMRPFQTDAVLMANPSSAHRMGRAAAAALAGLRSRVAQYFRCSAEHVVFNSGGSEGDTHALLGTALVLRHPLHLAVSAIEHEAVMVAAERLQRLGHRVSTIPVTGEGVVPVEAVEELLRGDRPDLISVMTVNNEIGTVQPVREIAALCREREVVFHTDAVRAVGHGLEDVVTDSLIGLLSCTAHKFGGPRGVGVLIQRDFKLPQLICGGAQEQGSRAGTENLAGIVGFVTALEAATAVEAERVEELRRKLEYELITRVPNCEIHGKHALRATHITSVSFKPRSGHKLQQALDDFGIAVGTGSACHDDGGISISPVLAAMGVDEYLAWGTLRISLGWSTTPTDVDVFLEHLVALLDRADDSLNCQI